MEPPAPDDLARLLAHVAGRPADVDALRRAGLVDERGALTPSGAEALAALQWLRDLGEGGSRGPPA